MNDPEKTFEYIKSNLNLSESEKASGRAHLLSLMKDRPAYSLQRSPFSAFLFSPALRIALAVLILICVGGTGVTYAAGNASPTSPLYAVKVKVTEPIQVALTLDPKDRADLEVKLVNDRLKEVAQASVDGTLTPDQTALITDSLSSQINGAQEDISALHKDQQSDDAFETASDLESALSAHTKILEKVQEVNPEASTSIAAVVSTVSDEIEETSDLADAAQNTLEDTATTTLDVSTDEQASSATDALAEVKQDVADALGSFDTSDRTDVNTALANIQSVIAQAQDADTAGNTTSAYLLYTQADQQLTELKVTIDADQSLGIDVIDATTTDTGIDENDTSE